MSALIGAASGRPANRPATVTAVKPSPTPFLEHIRRGWIERGWDPAHVDRYRMDETPPAPPTPPTPPTPPADPPPAGDLAALQRSIDAAKADGGKDAISLLLKNTGFASLEDLQAAAKAKIDADNAAKDEATRAREAADREKAEAAAEKATAAKATFDANLDRLLVACNVPVASLADVAVLVSAELGFKTDATPDEVIAATATVRTRQPALFATTADPPGTPHRAPSGTTPKPPPATTTTGLEAGVERARKALEARKGATRDDLIRQFTPGNGTSPLAPTA